MSQRKRRKTVKNGRSASGRFVAGGPGGPGRPRGRKNKRPEWSLQLGLRLDAIETQIGLVQSALALLEERFREVVDVPTVRKKLSRVDREAAEELSPEEFARLANGSSSDRARAASDFIQRRIAAIRRRLQQ